MSFLKNLFGGSKKKKYQFDKNFEKLFNKSCIATSSLQKMQADDLMEVRSYLEGKKGLQVEEALKQFFLIIEGGTFTLPARLKIMTTLHKYIIELGELFALEFLQYKFTNLLNYTPKKPKQILQYTVDVEDWIYENVLVYYFNYLLRLANNYQIYKICIEEGKLPQTEDAKLDYKLKFMWLFKLSNIFSYILKMHNCFSRVFKNYQSYFLIQDIALLVLHDCVSYYNVMSKEITELVQTYPLLTTIDSIQFYQVYCELLSLTDEMNTFYSMKQFFDIQNCIIEPSWFYVTAKVHKEIENYSRKVELLHTSANNMRRTLKNGDSSNLQMRQGGVNFTETAQYEKNRSKSALITTKGTLKNNSNKNLPDIKLQSTQSQQVKPNKLEEVESEEDQHAVAAQNNYQNPQSQHNRMKTENIFSASKKQEEYITDLQEEDLKAIKQYEELLKQQKSLNHDDDDEDQNNGFSGKTPTQPQQNQYYQQQQGANVDEEYDNEEGEDEINVNQFNNHSEEEEQDYGVQNKHNHHQNNNNKNNNQDQANHHTIIQQMQNVINNQSNQIGSDICFSPGKPYTFRCEQPPQYLNDGSGQKSNVQQQQQEQSQQHPEEKDIQKNNNHAGQEHVIEENGYDNHQNNQNENNHQIQNNQEEETGHQQHYQQQDEQFDEENEINEAELVSQFQKDLQQIEESEKSQDSAVQNGVVEDQQEQNHQANNKGQNKLESQGKIEQQDQQQEEEQQQQQIVDLNVSFS